MKTLYYLLILVSFTALPACDKVESKKATEPAGWFLSGSAPQEFNIGVDNQNPQQGEQSGFIESIETVPTGYGTLMQQCTGKDLKGERVKMTGYIQTMGTETTLTMMWIRVDDYDLQITADFDNMYDRPIIGTKYWTKCEIVFDVPESQCVVNVGLLLEGAGKAWIDNVSFDTVSISTFKTASNLNVPFPDESPFPEDLPEMPVNLDFEE